MFYVGDVLWYCWEDDWNPPNNFSGIRCLNGQVLEWWKGGSLHRDKDSPEGEGPATMMAAHSSHVRPEGSWYYEGFYFGKGSGKPEHFPD